MSCQRIRGSDSINTSIGIGLGHLGITVSNNSHFFVACWTLSWGNIW